MLIDTPEFSILITTKNRIEAIQYTLAKIAWLLEKPEVECIICNDGSIDNTQAFIEQNYPKIQLIHNEDSMGLIHSRNRLLDITKAKFAISLDDDAHFISKNILEIIAAHFNENPDCGVIAFRIFWGIDKPKINASTHKIKRVKGFVGCGHVWNMEAWKSIPKYPEWFVFYGEEAFASYQLFRSNWRINYMPDILVHHRVDVKTRKREQDYYVRLRRSLRSGWYLYLLFYPWTIIPRKFMYTLWIQMKQKVFKGDLLVLWVIFQAMFDVFRNLPRLNRNSYRLSISEFRAYSNIPDTEIYWKPKGDC